MYCVVANKCYDRLEIDSPLKFNADKSCPSAHTCMPSVAKPVAARLSSVSRHLRHTCSRVPAALYKKNGVGEFSSAHGQS